MSPRVHPSAIEDRLKGFGLSARSKIQRTDQEKLLCRLVYMAATDGDGRQKSINAQ